jgi:hypothetical protein
VAELDSFPQRSSLKARRLAPCLSDRANDLAFVTRGVTAGAATLAIRSVINVVGGNPQTSATMSRNERARAVAASRH